MKTVLLIFDDQEELAFIEANLIESGFKVIRSESLEKAVKQAERSIPDLIVVNLAISDLEIRSFLNLIKTERLKNSQVLNLIGLEDYLKASAKEHFVVKPVRPKLLLSLIRGLLNKEEISWFPSLR